MKPLGMAQQPTELGQYWGRMKEGKHAATASQEAAVWILRQALLNTIAACSLFSESVAFFGHVLLLKQPSLNTNSSSTGRSW